MRLFKLLRFFPTMGVQLTVIGNAVYELASFGFLLMLFVFVYAILGKPRETRRDLSLVPSTLTRPCSPCVYARHVPFRRQV